jgi:hypothetical protein
MSPSDEEASAATGRSVQKVADKQNRLESGSKPEYDRRKRKAEGRPKGREAAG